MFKKIQTKKNTFFKFWNLMCTLLGDESSDYRSLTTILSGNSNEVRL